MAEVNLIGSCSPRSRPWLWLSCATSTKRKPSEYSNDDGEAPSEERRACLLSFKYSRCVGILGIIADHIVRTVRTTLKQERKENIQCFWSNQ